MIDRLTEIVYALVESGTLDELNDGEGVGYDEACEILNLTDAEKAGVLARIDEDFRVV